MIANKAKQRMLAGEPAFGFEIVLGSVPVAEVLARGGIDFMQLDLQHGRWSNETALAFCMMMQGKDISPMARVQANDYWQLGRLLDDGMAGVIVPRIDTPKQARQVVEACRYPPEGLRSWGGRAGFEGTQSHTGRQFREASNNDIFVAVQIESATAVENAEAILATPGVDGCWLGPADLAHSMGIAFEDSGENDEHARAIERTLEACHNTGKIPGFASGSPEDAKARAEQGFRFLTCGNDQTYLANAGNHVLKTVGRE